jgi:hypothetical protein
MPQKFFKGDLVQVGAMPNYMSHFDGDCQAIVYGTYVELCGCSSAGDEKKYQLCILPKGSKSSWYEEDQLTFIAADQFSLLPENNYDRKVFEAKRARDGTA